MAAGAINIAAAATVGRGSTQNLAFFVGLGAAQLYWGAVAMVRAPRWWLALGAAGNLVAVVTWVVSRTAGLPIGEYAGIKLPVGFPDTLATALEAVIVVGAVALMISGRGLARSVARSPRVAVAAAVVAGALALAGYQGQPSWLFATLSQPTAQPGRYDVQLVTRDGRHLSLGGTVHAVLAAAGDMPRQQHVAVVVGRGAQPHAVATDIAVAHLEVVALNRKGHLTPPSRRLGFAARTATLLP